MCCWKHVLLSRHFYKNKTEWRKPYAKKMHVYSGEMIISAAPIISIFEKLRTKNGMGLTRLKRRILTSVWIPAASAFYSSSVRTVVKLASPDTSPGLEDPNLAKHNFFLQKEQINYQSALFSIQSWYRIPLINPFNWHLALQKKSVVLIGQS